MEGRDRWAEFRPSWERDAELYHRCLDSELVRHQSGASITPHLYGASFPSGYRNLLLRPEDTE